MIAADSRCESSVNMEVLLSLPRAFATNPLELLKDL